MHYYFEEILKMNYVKHNVLIISQYVHYDHYVHTYLYSI